jgi:hypothetical protein
MATNLDIHADVLQATDTDSCGAETDLPPTSESDEEFGGYIVYLTERALFEAYPRAKRENPNALVHFERHDDDLWALEVYQSEAAKEAYLLHFYYRQKALLYLEPMQGDERPHDARQTR